MAVFNVDVSLPLLAKELTEQSARRRTYIIRVVYALALFIVGGCVLGDLLINYGGSPLRILGQGRDVFEALVFTQFFGIYLLLPALTCGTLTQEKEQNTLPLLFLTKLGPWTIIFEKLLGRLLPMLMLVLLTSPLLAVAYTMGGVTQPHLGSGIWLMLVTSFQMASLAVMCSAWFRTTVGSFIGTYVVGMIVCFALPVLDEMRIIRAGYEEIMFAPALFDHASRSDFLDVLTWSLPILVSAIVFLLLARLFIVRRAFVPPKNVLINLLRPFDRGLSIALKRISAGRLQLRSVDDLPDERPVAWRETAKTVLGSFRYQLYICGAVTAVVGLCCLVIAADGGRNEEECATVYFLFLGFVALLVCVKSASLFASERSHQTLDILLTTPLSNRELLKQKFSAVFRLMWTFIVPFVVLLLFDTYWKQYHWQGAFSTRSMPFSPLRHIVSSVITVVIYLPMLAWLSLLFGLRIRNQVRAIFASLAAIIAWSILPLMGVFFLFEVNGIRPHDPWAIVLLSSPLPFLLFTEVAEVEMLGWPMWILLLLNSMIYGSALAFLRWVCLSRLDRHLKRADA